MKRIKELPTQTAMTLYKILIVIAAILVFVLIVGTVYGLVKRGKENTVPPQTGNASGNENIFSGMGTMRIPTADPEPETLVVSVAFPYDKNDRPFSEELASCISRFKSSAARYLGAFTAEELAALDINLVKDELLQRFNSELRLGQIRELYILEFMHL